MSKRIEKETGKLKANQNAGIAALKATFAVFLTLALSLCLFACSGGSSGGETQSESTAESGDETTSAASSENAVSLKFSTFHASTDRTGVLDQQFVDYVTEATQGSVDIEVYWSSSLMDVSTAFTETLAGVSDITVGSTGYLPDHFVVDNAMGFFINNEASYEDNFKIMWEIYEACDEWQAEYEGTTVLNFTNAIGANMAILSKEPIDSLDDLKGKTLRCTETGVFALMEELGANPVRMSLSEAYDALSKGVIDGIVNGHTTFWQQSMAEIAGYMTELNYLAPMTVQGYISDSAMEKLSEDQQQAITEAAHKAWEDDTVALLEDQEAQAYEYLEGAGVEIFTLTDSEYEQINEAWEAIAATKIEELNAAGYDGQAIYDMAREIIEKYE